MIDEKFGVVRKMDKVDWLDGEPVPAAAKEVV